MAFTKPGARRCCIATGPQTLEHKVNACFCEPSQFGVVTGFPGGSDGKESTCNEGDVVLIPGLGRSPREQNGTPFLYSCLENSMDRGACWATKHGASESDPTEQLNTAMQLYCYKNLLQHKYLWRWTISESLIQETLFLN